MTAGREALWTFLPSWDALLAFPGGLIATYLLSLTGFFSIAGVWAAVVWVGWIAGVVIVTTIVDLRRSLRA